jgi:hypothetical protein
MAGYLIYIPNVSGADPTHLDRVGLRSLHSDAAPMMADLPAGPDGGQGVLVYWDNPSDPDSVPAATVNPAQQEWLPAPEFDGLPAGRYWLGVDKARRPRPSDLRRKKLRDGKEIELADGNKWMIPVARQLPHVLGIGVRRIRDDYKAFYERALAALQWLNYSGESLVWRCSEQAMYTLTCAALSVNYRLTEDMCSLLGLVDTENAVLAVEAVCDGSTIERMLELAKKKTATAVASNPTSSTTDSGEQD